MDTNSLILLVEALRSQGTASREWMSPALIAAAIGALAALAALFQARTAAIKATLSESNTKESKVTAEKTAVEVEKIHVAVNSRDTAMQAELQKLRQDLLRLTGEKTSLQEATRARELADATAKGTVGLGAASGPAAVVEIVAPASEGGGALSDPQLAQWISTLQAEQTARTKK